jgi:brefeldin A-inhibited guanine nucleotide-exchange protein
VFIQDIFMEILESPNSKFIVKFFILQVLTNLIEKESIPFELFLNFDCREDSTNILERTIDLLVKIAQGKYEKNIYAGMINASDEEQLQQEAIQAIIRLIKSSWKFLENTSESKDQQVTDAPKNLSAILDKKKQIDEAIHRFNVGKKNSLKVLVDLRIIREESPEALSEFLRTDKRVSQVIIGEVLGGDEEFNLAVLSDFMKNIGMGGKTILQALKHTLSLFELPGEGQKVERILEYFSKQYAIDNPELHEDAAYLLSFLLMMCHTSLYNPQVQDKMTLVKYLSIGKEIKNNGETISPDVLTTYYNEIVATPLAVHSLERRKQEIANTISRSTKEKHELFKQESQRMFETLSSKIQAGNGQTDYQFASDPSVLRVFISTIWTNLLAFFSTVIANCDKVSQLKSLVDSCVLMIRICDHFNMQTERDSFVNLLVQFSGLEKTWNKLFDEKNLLFMQAVLLIASKMGNHLHRGWTFVLNCVVSLNFYHFQADKLRGNIAPNQVLTVDEQNSLFVAVYFLPESLANIFIDSSKLDEHSIIDFINGLCVLALKEMEKMETRFCYILEQIVYVAYENLYRNPIEWLRIWDIFDKMFEDVLAKADVVKPEVVEFAIDTLHKLIICSFKNKSLITHKYQRRLLGVYTTVCSSEIIRQKNNPEYRRVPTDFDEGLCETDG